MNQEVKVSVIIPCRNEERFIGKCLDSLLEQDYSKEKLEVLVIDGMSEDRTREIVKNYSRKFPFIKILENPKKYTPFGLNIGIKEAKGEIIIRMDAHAGYDKNYISKCVENLEKYRADNVGGTMITLPAKNTIIAKAIAICLSHSFGAGGSYFRTGVKTAREVDTVFGGCYKREVFEKIGLFNENLIKAQDLEFNLRLKRAGGKIILAPDIVSYYYPKSDLGGFFSHTFINGIWTIYALKFIKIPFKIRHYVPLFFVVSLIGPLFLSIFFPVLFWLFLFIIFLYCLTNIYFSLKIAKQEKNSRHLFIMPVVFATRHIAYGLGSIFGLFKLIINGLGYKNE